MKIDKTNEQIIESKDISIHDDILDNLVFNRKEKKMILYLSDERYNDRFENIYKYNYSIIFNDVLGFEMTAFDYWGKSPHVFDFEYVKQEEQRLIPKLYEKGKNIEEGLLEIKNIDNYIECIITFTSGDTLTVVCEFIDFMKEKYFKE